MLNVHYELTDLNGLIIRDGSEADIVTWQGHPCLRLNGMVIVPDLQLSKGSIEVDIGAEGASYCGIAFRITDTLNYELVYAQPHTSGRWDALQYDPVFHGCNTWQLIHGPGAQQVAEVPTGEWFHLRADFQDQRAIVRINDQPPLIISRLVHPSSSGLIGLWSYLPAHFRNLRISGECNMDHYLDGVSNDLSGVITEWFLHGYGRVVCEYNGILNLNRYLPVATTEAQLSRRFRVTEQTEGTLHFGFSDEIAVRIDGQLVYEGENKFQGITNDLGYVSLDKQVTLSLSPGIHTIELTLKRTEYFGYGLIAQLPGDHIELLPCL